MNPQASPETAAYMKGWSIGHSGMPPWPLPKVCPEDWKRGWDDGERALRAWFNGPMQPPGIRARVDD